MALLVTPITVSGTRWRCDDERKGRFRAIKNSSVVNSAPVSSLPAALRAAPSTNVWSLFPVSTSRFRRLGLSTDGSGRRMGAKVVQIDAACRHMYTPVTTAIPEIWAHVTRSHVHQCSQLSHEILITNVPLRDVFTSRSVRS